MELAKYEAGRPGSSNAVKRRQSIHQGRQLARRKARHRDLYISLQERGLLPYAGKKAEQRHLQLTELDRKLTNEWLPRIKTEAPDIPDPGRLFSIIYATSPLPPNFRSLNWANCSSPRPEARL